MNGSKEIQPAAGEQIGVEGMNEGFPGAGVLPAMIALVAGLPGRAGGKGGKIIPGSAGGELVEDELENEAIIEARATAGGGGEERLKKQPLHIGEEGGKRGG